MSSHRNRRTSGTLPWLVRHRHTRTTHPTTRTTRRSVSAAPDPSRTCPKTQKPSRNSRGRRRVRDPRAPELRREQRDEGGRGLDAGEGWARARLLVVDLERRRLHRVDVRGVPPDVHVQRRHRARQQPRLLGLGPRVVQQGVGLARAWPGESRHTALEARGRDRRRRRRRRLLGSESPNPSCGRTAGNLAVDVARGPWGYVVELRNDYAPRRTRGDFGGTVNKKDARGGARALSSWGGSAIQDPYEPQRSRPIVATRVYAGKIRSRILTALASRAARTCILSMLLFVADPTTLCLGFWCSL